MPLARMILSMSQRCSLKRRTRGGPRRSRIGGKLCCGRFMHSLRLADGGRHAGQLCLVTLAPVTAVLSARRMACCQRASRYDRDPRPNRLRRRQAVLFRQDEDDPMKLAVPDMISNSYFPAEAAVELGFFKAEGLDVSLELIFPVDKAYAALRDGAVDFVGGSAHSALAAFPDFRGVKLICAQAQGMYWFLVMHADLKAKRGDLSVVKGRGIGAAPRVDKGLRALLAEAGIDIARDEVTIAPVPGAAGAGTNFGLTAARAVVKTQAALKANVARAAEVGAKLFPPSEAALIVELIRRDLPYYDAALSPDFVSGMTGFARRQHLLAGQVAYADVVAAQFAPLWTGS